MNPTKIVLFCFVIILIFIFGTMISNPEEDNYRQIRDSDIFYENKTQILEKRMKEITEKEITLMERERRIEEKRVELNDLEQKEAEQRDIRLKEVEEKENWIREQLDLRMNQWKEVEELERELREKEEKLNEREREQEEKINKRLKEIEEREIKWFEEEEKQSEWRNQRLKALEEKEDKLKQLAEKLRSIEQEQASGMDIKLNQAKERQEDEYEIKMKELVDKENELSVKERKLKKIEDKFIKLKEIRAKEYEEKKEEIRQLYEKAKTIDCQNPLDTFKSVPVVTRKNGKKLARSLNIGYTLKSHEGDLPMLTIFFQSFLVSVPAYTFKEFYFVTNDPINNTLAAVIPPFAKIYNETLPPYIKDIPGFNHQQWTSLFADNYITAAYVGILDSDQILHTTVTSRKIFTEDGKLILMKRNCHVRGAYYCSAGWNEGANYLMGLNLDYNYMINLPFYFPTDILPRFRAHVEKHTGLPFNEAFYNIGHERKTICQVCFLGAYLEAFEPWRIHAVEDPYPTISEHAGWTTKLRYGMDNKFNANFLKVSSASLSRGYCNQFNIKKGYIPEFCQNFTVPINQVELYTFTWEGKDKQYFPNVTLNDYFIEENEFTIPVRPNDHEIIYQVQEVDDL